MTRLDIFSDPICPWCYIGLARLRAGIEAAGGNPFEVTWRPFMLNPDMPVEGMDRRAYLAAKFGADRVDEIYGVIEETAQAEGLDVDFSKPARTPNT
ncbi:MAG: DsbA family oxidoreductase, partial [Rubricella sp.]